MMIFQKRHYANPIAKPAESRMVGKYIRRAFWLLHQKRWMGRKGNEKQNGQPPVDSQMNGK